MNSFEENFETWYKQIRTDNKYHLMWSAGLETEVTKGSVETQINNAIKEKINSNYY